MLADVTADMDIAQEYVYQGNLALYSDPAFVDEELAHYAAFRGAQAKLGRNWRDWPVPARDGDLSPEHIDPDEERCRRAAEQLKNALVLNAPGTDAELLENEGVADMASDHHPATYGDQLWNYFARSYPANVEAHYGPL